MGMSRAEAIELAANEIAMALTRKGYVNIKNGKDEPRIDALYKALAMPKVDAVNISPECVDENANRKHDAERVALIQRIDNHMEDNSDLFDLLRDIRAYLNGDAPKPIQPIIQSQQYNDEVYKVDI
jgi:hypothetical protein